MGFLAAILIFLSPELQINWLNEARPAVEFNLIGEDKLFDKCLSRGQEIRYRFEFKLCKKRSLFDDCSKEFVETHFLSWSPISNSYSMVVDRHRDQKLPQGIQYHTKQEAELAMRKISKLDILNLFNLNEVSQKHYVHARAFSECRGEYNHTLVELSYYLTLGLVRLSGFNTGWYDYELHD